MTSTRREFGRLARLFEVLGYNLAAQSPASEREIQSIDEITGVHVDDSLKDLWRITDGSADQLWFVQGIGCSVPYIFLSIKDVIAGWRLWSPYDAAHYKRWNADDESRDSRIQRRLIYHNKWLPFAACDGGSRTLNLDAEPTSHGNPGQIINCVWDENTERVLWVADSFSSMFKTSNDSLERAIRDDATRTARFLRLLL